MTDELVSTAPEAPLPDPLAPTLTPSETAIAEAVQADDVAVATVASQTEDDVHGWFRHMLRLIVKHSQEFGLDLKAEIDKVL